MLMSGNAMLIRMTSDMLRSFTQTSGPPSHVSTEPAPSGGTIREEVQPLYSSALRGDQHKQLIMKPARDNRVEDTTLPFTQRATQCQPCPIRSTISGLLVDKEGTRHLAELSEKSDFR